MMLKSCILINLNNNVLNEYEYSLINTILDEFQRRGTYMKFQKVFYPGAYLMTPKELVVNELDAYEMLSIGDHKLYYSNSVRVEEYRIENNHAILIGYCFDTRDAKHSQEDVIRNLMINDNLVEELEYINGRYILILDKGMGVTLYSDASQLQPMVYHKGSKTLSSHDNLLNSVLSSTGIMLSRRPEKVHTELDFTRYEEIFKLNPSLKLEIDGFTFIRIYPRTVLNEKTVEETFEEMDKLLVNSRNWLAKQPAEKFLTLTAGIDSRVSAAVSRDMSSDIEFLTYYTPSKYLATRMAKTIHKIDTGVTKQMRENMQWNHSIISIRDYRPPQDDLENMKEFYNSHHAFGLINYYRNEKKYNHAIHIKSTVFGMGKADFDEALDTKEDTFNFYKKCIHGLPKTFEDHYDFDTEIENYFERNLITEGVTKGRHFFDLFHLEARMGNWHSTLTLETDPETDEFIYMNTRKLIDLMQQPNIDERRDFSLYKLIINEYWPVLLHFGINNETNLYEKSTGAADKNLEAEENQNGVKITPYNGMRVRKVKNNVYRVRPGTGKTKIEDVNNVSIEPVDGQKQRVKIKSMYNNPKGKGRIRVVIRLNNEYKEYDIIDLNKPIELELDSSACSIMVLYNSTFKNASWRDAGLLEIAIN